MDGFEGKGKEFALNTERKNLRQHIMWSEPSGVKKKHNNPTGKSKHLILAMNFTQWIRTKLETKLETRNQGLMGH